MKLEILQVPDCPNVVLLEERIAQAVAGEKLDLTITHRVLDDPESAADAGMTGSPTLLLDGEDPFANPGLTPSVSCRLYPGESGGVDGAPSTAALRAALHLTPAEAPVEESAGSTHPECSTRVIRRPQQGRD